MKFLNLFGPVLFLVASVCAPHAGCASDPSGSIGAPPEVEPEVSQRFGYWEKEFPYRVDDPVYTVVYTEEQKQAQRKAAREMAGALLAAAMKSTDVREFTVPAGGVGVTAAPAFFGS